MAGIDKKTLGAAQAYTEEKIKEAGGMTSEGVAEIVKDTVGTEVNAYLPEYFAITKDIITWNSNGYINVGNGNVYTDSRYVNSESIALDTYNIEKLYIDTHDSSGNAGVAFYAEDGTYISGVASEYIESVEIPDTAKYVRFSLTATRLETATINLSYRNMANTLKGVKNIVDTIETTDDESPLSHIITDGNNLKIFRTMGVIGDSLASGEMAYGDATDESTTQYVDMYEHSWIQHMARYCGNTAYNFSKGGLSTRTFLADTGGYLTDMLSSEKKCQCYFIALGHNDINQGVSVGTSADINTEDYTQNADTFYGNYAGIIQRIKEVSPNAKIFVITLKISNGETNGMNDAIRYMETVFNNVYVLDMYKYAPKINYEWEYTQGHGNAMGYLNYSYQISSYVDWIIRNNREDFKYVQFINTEYESYIP